MDILLTWDLFVIVFFGIVMSYSFIIGKHESIKIIVFTYIAIVAGQGLGNMFQQLSSITEPYLLNLGLSVDVKILGSTKLFIFIATIILLASRGGFEVHYTKESSSVANALLTACFGFAKAGLLLSTVLTFIAAAPLLDAGLAQAAALSPIVQGSRLMEIMIVYQNLWFSFPALLLIGVGLMSNKQ